MWIYYWNNTLPTGFFVDEKIQHDLNILAQLITHLKSNNYVLLGYTTGGIIIDDNTDRDELNDIDIKLHKLEDLLHSLDLRVLDLEIITPINPESDVKELDSGAFYLLYGMLPEEFQKKLKIYIKQE